VTKEILALVRLACRDVMGIGMGVGRVDIDDAARVVADAVKGRLLILVSYRVIIDNGSDDKFSRWFFDDVG
jgi:hypothetical protein